MSQKFQAFIKKLKQGDHAQLKHTDDHTLPFLVADAAAEAKKHGNGATVLVASNHSQMTEFTNILRFIAPQLTVLPFPAWDVQPYDRLSADADVQAQRMRVLSALRRATQGLVIVTTVGAMATKVPPEKHIGLSLQLKAGQQVNRDKLVTEMTEAGYRRVNTVMEAGEFAVRGALMDIFPSSAANPIRLDFFDNDLEEIQTFDPASQRSIDNVNAIDLFPASEVVLSEEAISQFRTSYRSNFPQGMKDPLYVDISEGRSSPSMGHYLPLFYPEALSTLASFLPDETTFFGLSSFTRAKTLWDEQVRDAYEARKEIEDLSNDEEPYRPLPPELLYVTGNGWDDLLDRGKWLFASFEDKGEGKAFDPALESHLTLASQKTADKTIAKLLAEKVRKQGTAGGTVVISAFSLSSIERIKRILQEEDIHGFASYEYWPEEFDKKLVNLVVSPVTWGFTDNEKQVLLFTEQDIFGEKQNTSAKRPRRKAEEMIHHFSDLNPGDLVVHAEHGIGKFVDLRTMETGGQKQDYICLEYDKGDKLYVPVVALDLLSRYSSEETAGSKVDRLGSAAWQARKAKVKKRLLDMAEDLIKTAAQRAQRTRPPYQKPEGLYDEFCAGFPYVPTPEQQQAIDDVESDLFSGQPMDRLVVGDVGFGKTEVALRAAFVAAADGRQVAVVVPTTLLARQHYLEFKRRFAGMPINVKGLSRLTAGKEAKEVKEGLKKGTVDIVVGTHAILSKSIEFNNLGLVVIDEEQRFGVAHKERMKELRSTVDVLTLTATPIPRTLHMSMSGLKELSTITTPPVDRLAIRTFMMGFDSKVIREAIQREIHRNGQVYVVTPRVNGMNSLAQKLRELVPEAKIRTAHGQMDKNSLENIMSDFYDGKFNVLVATTIIESGLDVPTANTMIVHRSDSFGLAQLYQLRGRVGRGKTRAYAYLLIPPGGRMTEDAHKRLQILSKLDHIGAGFSLASFDMDLRGPGNILGSEQSGFIREVGFELYNQMLADAIRKRKSGEGDLEVDDAFTPVLNLGLTYRIPEEYVDDLATRMRLYRRLSSLSSVEDVTDMQNELIDRFGKLPPEVGALFKVVALRNKCRELNIEKIETGDKGVLIGFYKDTFANPDGLLHYILAHPGVMSLRADQKVLWHRRWPDGVSRLQAIERLLEEFKDLAAKKVA